MNVFANCFSESDYWRGYTGYCVGEGRIRGMKGYVDIKFYVYGNDVYTGIHFPCHDVEILFYKVFLLRKKTKTVFFLRVSLN